MAEPTNTRVSSPERRITYSPLNIARDEIRILVMEPAPEDEKEDGRIRARLEHVSLHDLDNEFTALSYHWGDHNSLKRIMVAGELVPITVNLYKALEELRRRGLYRVWADDLCIDREDAAERGRQLLRMGCIYRSASSVVAHLRGPTLSCQQALFEAIQRITKRAEILNRAGKRARSEAKREAWERRKSTISMAGTETAYGAASRSEITLRSAVSRHSLDLSATEETALLLFLDNPFWRRAWIIQEIAMNPQLTIVWGRQDFNLSQVIQTLSLLGHYVSGKRERLWNHIKCLYKIRVSQLALKPLSLVDALGICYLAKAQYIRDHVFALLGLTHDGAYLVPFPSYDLPQEDINRDMTIRLIRATGCFDVILFKGYGVDTWYPNWFDPKFWHAYRISHLHRGRPSLGTYTSYGIYRASRRHTPSFKVNGHSITAQGFFLGTLTDCSPTLDEAKESGLPKDELVQFRAWKRDAKTEELFFDPSSAATMSTLCWLLIDITRPRTRDRRPGVHLYTLIHTLMQQCRGEAAQQMPSLLMQWLNCCEERGFKIDGQQRLAAYFSMKSSKKNNIYLSADERDTLEQDCRTLQRNLRANLRLGCTDAAEMGWFHRNAKPGDQVAVLLGSSMPCLLRKRPAPSEGYTIVGQCIVDGVMKGEAVKRGMQRLQGIEIH